MRAQRVQRPALPWPSSSTSSSSCSSCMVGASIVVARWVAVVAARRIEIQPQRARVGARIKNYYFESQRETCPQALCSFPTQHTHSTHKQSRVQSAHRRTPYVGTQRSKRKASSGRRAPQPSAAPAPGRARASGGRAWRQPRRCRSDRTMRHWRLKPRPPWNDAHGSCTAIII